MKLKNQTKSLVLADSNLDDIFVATIYNLVNVIVLGVTHSTIRNISDDTFMNCWHMTILTLHDNSIHSINKQAFNGLFNLIHLDISKNPIPFFYNVTFSILLKLRHLNLSYTSVSYISENTFKNNSNLISLDFSNSLLSQLTDMSLSGLVSLRVLSLSHSAIPLYSFAHVDIKTNLPALTKLHVVHAEVCCLVPGVNCVPDVVHYDSIGSCSDIIAHVSLLCTAYIFSLSVFALNSMSFSWHIQQKTIPAYFQCSLTIADTMMAIYLSVIIVSNHVYSGNVIFIAVFWKETALCATAGVLFMVSVLASNISTLLIALDRCLCMVLRGPFATRGFTTRQMVLCICIGWFTALLLPTLASMLSQPVTNSACIPVGGESTSVIFSSIYVAVNSLVFLCTSCYILQYLCCCQHPGLSLYQLCIQCYNDETCKAGCPSSFRHL